MSSLVSIIIPTYNRAHTLPDTLKSVHKQTHENWECIIVDDISTDDTLDKIQDFLEDERFIYIKRSDEQRKGAASCRNIGLKHAKGDFIQFLDSDDLLAKNKLEAQLANIRSHIKSLAICKWGVIKFDLSSFNIYEKLPTYKDFKNGLQLFDAFGYYFTYFPPHVYLASRDLIEESGFWDEDLTLNDDGDYFSKVILNASEISYSDDTFVLYRRGGTNRVSSDYSEYGINSFIKSWTNIDKRIQKKFNVSNQVFVRQSRRNMYTKIKTKHPDIISKNKYFFSKKMTEREYVFRKLIAKIKGFA